jgi:signal transduction histidine kinase
LNEEGSYNTDGSLGLGLYIAREIAKAHGGEIEARSDETETVFAVRLPRGQ